MISRRWPQSDAAAFLVAPMSPRQFAVAAACLVPVGTIYCQLYCAIAYQPMRGALMPLSHSIAWALALVMPWLACFEACKRARLPGIRPLARPLAMVAAFAFAASLSIILELGLDQLIEAHTRPLARQFGAQFTAATLVGMLLLFGRNADPVTAQCFSSEPLAEIRMLGRDIEWVEAAGNYVQVHARGRSSLHRITMRELEASLDPAAFARVHRSAIVALDAVEARVLVGGSPAVRLRDGTLLKIGSRYSANIARLAV